MFTVSDNWASLAGGGDDPLLGIQKLCGGESRRPALGENRLAVGPSQLWRFGQRAWRLDPDGPRRMSGGCDDPLHQLIPVRGPDRARLPLCLGANVMDIPRRSRRGQHPHDLVGQRLDLELPGMEFPPLNLSLDIGFNAGDVQDGLGLTPPGVDHLLQGAAELLIGTIRQGRLLVQLQSRRIGRLMAMFVAIAGKQLPIAALNIVPPFRKARDQRCGNSNDLSDGTMTLISSGPLSKRHLKAGSQLVLYPGVVALRERHGGGEQRPPIQGSPLTVQALHLVRNRHMRVQVRVAGTRVPMIEHRRDHPGRIDLRLPLSPGTGIGGIAFQPVDRIGNRRLMSLMDLSTCRYRPQAPQHRNRLHRREDKVITRHRRLGRSSGSGIQL
nr:hypothetical protein [Microlunatus endophyticus]